MRPHGILLDAEDAIGKTVKRVAIESEDVVLFLTDANGIERFLVVHVSADCDHCDKSEVSVDLRVQTDFKPQDLQELNLITETEYTQAMADILAESEKRMKEHRRMEYERLKAEFDGGAVVAESS